MAEVEEEKNKKRDKKASSQENMLQQNRNKKNAELSGRGFTCVHKNMSASTCPCFELGSWQKTTLFRFYFFDPFPKLKHGHIVLIQAI